MGRATTFGRAVARIGEEALPIRAHLIGVYRETNARVMEALVHEAAAAGWRVSLWALDGVPPALEPVTLGSGPGAKFDLLNRLNDTGGADEWLVVTDDDVVVSRNGLTQFLVVATAAGFALAQPAHTRRSHSNHRITRRWPLSVARLTTFVEIGPLFAIAPSWRRMFTPFPGDAGMGYGLDLLWHVMQRDMRFRMGIVDKVTLRHVDPAGASYRVEDHTAVQDDIMRSLNVATFGELQTVMGHWWLWERWPRWLSS